MKADRSMLELKGISKAFGAIVVASDIDLTLSRGEALGVIGPNGAGKSTLFNLITGMLRPDRGRIILEDEDITQMPPEARCRAGLGRSFQIPLPFTHLTVFENLSVAALFGAQVSEAEAVQLCGEILSLTGLETKANAPCRQPAAARSQAIGIGAGARDPSAHLVARRNRRRPDGRGMSSARRDHPGAYEKPASPSSGSSTSSMRCSRWWTG